MAASKQVSVALLVNIESARAHLFGAESLCYILAFFFFQHNSLELLVKCMILKEECVTNLDLTADIAFLAL